MDSTSLGDTRVRERDGGGLRASSLALGVGTTVIFVAALALRGTFVLGLVALAAIFIPMEKLFALHPRKVFRQAWTTDLVHFVVNNLLTTVGLVAVVYSTAVVLRILVPVALRTAVRSQPGGLQILEAFVLSELCQYAAHRSTHQIPWLWRFHAVHHSISEMDWLAAGRLHPIDQVFTRSCVVLPLFVLGFSKATFGAFLVFASFQAIFIHANVRFRFGPLRWIITTPEFHHWHHANEPAAYNTNFAGECPLVDLLFGTLYLPKGRMPSRYGIDDPGPDGYLRQLVWPFRHRREVHWALRATTELLARRDHNSDE
jgi:sterol desaturase/sphingolipid hydroxylase (fatty acid hydroxylase superfamily)